MKRNAILLQEPYRRDGHVDFIKRASEVCGVPRSTLKKCRQQYLNGIYSCTASPAVADIPRLSG